MSIRKEIKELFNEYHQHAGNIVRGQIDWDFVEADIMMDLGVDRIVEEMGSLEQFYVLFNSSSIISEKLSAIKSLENGSESIILLSQYIGDFHPEAQTKGLSGLSFIASSLSKISAV